MPADYFAIECDGLVLVIFRARDLEEAASIAFTQFPRRAVSVRRASLKEFVV